jgi:hypothetical protein
MITSFRDKSGSISAKEMKVVFKALGISATDEGLLAFKWNELIFFIIIIFQLT